MDVENHIKDILEQMEPGSERLKKTPERAAKAYGEFFSGYDADVATVAGRFYDSRMDDLVILKNIAFESYCEHHLVPIVGNVAIGYLPNGKILGASKLARLVDCFAHRLQLQERMTMEIGQTLEQLLSPLGVGVYVDADHFCISRRGVKKPGARLVTRYFCGVFKDTPNLRQEFLDTVARN